MSGRHKLLGGGDAETQARYQADLLKNISESRDSGSESEDQDEDKGEGSSKGKERARDNEDDGE